MKHIRTKILAGFLIILLIAAVQGIVNGMSFHYISSESEQISESELPQLEADHFLSYAMTERLALVRGFLLTGDPRFEESFEAVTAEADAVSAEVLQQTSNEASIEAIQQAEAWTDAVRENVFPVYQDGREQEALAYMNSAGRTDAEELMAYFQGAAADRSSQVALRAENVNESSNLLFLIAVGAGVLVIVTGLVTAFVTAGSIAKPVHSVTNRLRELADGNLSGPALHVRTKDETKAMVDSLNQMTENNRILLQQIGSVAAEVENGSTSLAHASEDVRGGSAQIASTMEQLAAGAENQASVTTTLSSSMASFSETMAQSSSNVEQALQSSDDVLKLTDSGTNVVLRSGESMQRIDERMSSAVTKMDELQLKTDNISKLVTVIEDIAAQTNLLALNAAIEAARAGEQGRGFAVVADEVRRLAEQVTGSVADITNIVHSVQQDSLSVAESLQKGYEETSEGSSNMKATEQTFTAIQASITELADQMREIGKNVAGMSGQTSKIHASLGEAAASAEEAAAGIQETTASAEETDRSMEQMASSASSLSGSAKSLRTELDRFRLS